MRSDSASSILNLKSFASYVAWLVSAFCIAFFCAHIPQARAQADNKYPSRPVRFVVPFIPGGSVDIFARILGQKLGEKWGQPVIVENRGGASGIIGAEAVARAPADGYVLFLGTNGTHAANSSLFKKLPYDPIRDFAPIILLASIPHVIVVNPQIPAHSLRELIALAKEHPGELRYGSAGNGSSMHLSGELFKQATGTNLAHIPYKGGAAAVTDLLADRTQVMFAVEPLVISQIKSGKLRALAIMADKRSPLLPEVPTTAEAGVAGVESTAWIGLLAPAGTPKAIVEKLNASVKEALRDKKIGPLLEKQGFSVDGGTPGAFSAFIKSETAKWKEVIEKSGAKLD